MRSMSIPPTKLIVCLAAAATVGLWSPDAVAKKVICIDGGGDAYLNNHEGWSRAGATVPRDVIQVGGNLLDCLSQLDPGDTLVIVAHGWNFGDAFTWGGTQYTGFGPGPGQGTNPHPTPPDWKFGFFVDVTVNFCSCWSARDPDGGGPDRSLTDKIADALNPFPIPPPNNTATGFVGTADAQADANLDAPNEAAFNAANACLADPANQNWGDLPPANRPGANPNQQTKAQAIVDACPGAAGTMVTIKYLAPVDGGFAAGGGPAFQLGCVCPTTPPGCGLASFFIGGPAVIPTASQWGLIVMGLLLLTAGTIVIRRYKAQAAGGATPAGA